jgi:conjugative relaxase-like TrwC/TraI family protein
LHHEVPAAHLTGVTVSMRVMSAGDGYQYLLQSVAAGDGHRSLTQPLIAYYSEKGCPPGYWLGIGTHGLGTSDRRIEPGATVSEDHLRRLLGQGRDPVTGEPLGLPYFHHKTVEERIAARVEHLDPDLSTEHRAAAVERIEGEERERGSRRTVAGYDYTFSVPKSVSALWAIADATVQARIVEAHHQAVADVVALMERDVAATRVGHAGVAQVATRGLIATAYDHYDSRAADPQLHTHVVIANKVQGEDGKWRSLDGRPMHQAVVALSEHYNALLADRMTRALGVGWEQRDRGRDRNPAWEIVGVPDELSAEFSSRSAVIEAETDRLIDTYVSDHGHRPDERTVLRLRQQATLSTRPDKTHYSLAELTDQWRRRADRLLGQDAASWAQHVLATGSDPVLRAEDVGRDELVALGQVVVEQVQEKRSTWGRWNLSAEASRQTMGLRFASTSDREAVIGLITDAAEAASLRLTPPELTAAPAAFTRPDGSSVFRPRHSTIYTSTALLAAEDRLLNLSRAATGPALDPTSAARIARSPDEQGRVLSADQQPVVERISTSGRTVDVLVGPAGAGKTLALGALRRAWEAEHGSGSVIGLAPSAAAAEVLASDLGIGTENTAKWLYEHDHGRWDLTAEQLVIVDEASLAGTMLLDQLAAHAAVVGAKVLLAGDPAQLAAVDAGGAFGLLVRDRNASDEDGTPELADIRRFKNEWEKAASLRLRRGDTDVIDLYDEHGRIIGGGHDDMLDAAYRAWRTDVAAGRSSILIAETSDTVTALNQRARADRILARQVAVEGVALHDGTVAGEGDTIVTRENDRRLTTGRSWVKNGDRWTVVDAHPDGSLTVRRPGSRGRRGRVTLPAGYVAKHVELGYAITAHRAQGATVDTTHLVVHSSSMTREAFYVAMTRGRQANIAYVATDEAHLEDHQHTPGHDTGEVTARTVLYGVLQHQGAEKSAHETIEAEQEKWSSIAQLASEYETIAQTAQHQRFASAVAASGLDTDRTETVVGGESFGSLIAQLRRTEADGHQPERLLSRAIRAGGLDNAHDPAAVLTARLAKLTAARSGGTRPRRRPRYVAELIPEASGPMPNDMHRTLTELQALIEQRATVLASQAVQEGQSWVRRLGPPPSDPARRDAWEQQFRTIAAYRDRYDITGNDPVGPAPSGQGQRLDHQRADAAARRAQATAHEDIRRRHGPEQQIDSGRDLSR